MRFAIELLTTIHSASLYGIMLWYILNLPDDGSRVVVAAAASVGSTALAIAAYLLCWLFIGR